MSRRIRLVLFILFASFAVGTTACANINGPAAECGVAGSGC